MGGIIGHPRMDALGFPRLTIVNEMPAHRMQRTPCVSFLILLLDISNGALGRNIDDDLRVRSLQPQFALRDMFARGHRDVGRKMWRVQQDEACQRRDYRAAIGD